MMSDVANIEQLTYRLRWKTLQLHNLARVRGEADHAVVAAAELYADDPSGENLSRLIHAVAEYRERAKA